MTMAKGKRRANGEGTVWYEPKTQRWRARITIQGPTGPKSKALSGKTQEEVIAKKAQAIAERDSGLVFDVDNPTVADYLNRWLTGSLKDSIRPSTYARYEQNVRKHLIPAIGKMRLKKLSAMHLEGLYRAKLAEGLAPRTVNYIHTTMSAALKEAVRLDVMSRNVASVARAPQPNSPEMTPLNREQARAFLEAAKGDRLEALYILALSTGMRRSELLGLKWEDVDLNVGIILVRRGLTIHPDGGIEINDPKRFTSKRRLDISPKVMAALREHRKRQAKQKLAATHWRDEGFVFTSHSGGHIHLNTLYTAYFKPLRKRAGIPPVKFHDLRHTYATLALLAPNAKVKVVSEVLGHKDIATTLRIYAHVLPSMQRESAEAMDEVLF